MVKFIFYSKHKYRVLFQTHAVKFFLDPFRQSNISSVLLSHRGHDNKCVFSIDRWMAYRNTCSRNKSTLRTIPKMLSERQIEISIEYHSKCVLTNSMYSPTQIMHVYNNTT